MSATLAAPLVTASIAVYDPNALPGEPGYYPPGAVLDSGVAFANDIEEWMERR